MDFIVTVLRFCVVFVISTKIFAKVPGPENLQFVEATLDTIAVSFNGIADAQEYEVSIQALYDETDTNGWIMSLSGAPTTSTISLDNLDGLRSNILYKVKVAGILDGEVGNFSEVIGRTAAAGLDMTPAHILPSIAVIYVAETPGATSCEVAYNKVGQSIASEQFLQSEEDCRVNIIRNLEANTDYYVRGRVLSAGGHNYPDNEYGQAIGFTTAKLSLYARADQDEPYDKDLADQSTVAYNNRAASASSSLLSLHKANGADASEINILQFETKAFGTETVIHYEILLEAPVLPSSLDDYNFIDDSGEFVLSKVDSKVKPDTYSLVKTGDDYRLRYNDNTNSTVGCPIFDSRQLVISNSVDYASRATTLQGFSPLGTTDFTIFGTALTSSGANIYFFDNNSASAISQKYLLKSCPDGESELLFSRYYGANDASTTQGVEDVFVHSTDLFSFPGIRSVGIKQGNGSIVTFKRVSNAVEYVVSGGGNNATLDITLIDSSVEFEIELFPINAGMDINAALQIITKPYDDPKEKANPISLNTLPSLPTGVTWPYRDENNLTLAWDKDDGAVGYFINVQWDRQGTYEFEQEFEIFEPEAKMNNLKPGRYYFVKVIPYNHAGNASDDAGYQLYTNKDDPFLMNEPVNVSDSHITVEWSGGKDANSVELFVIPVNNSSNISLSFDVTTPSPFTIPDLEPETEYNVTVVVTYDTGTTRSPYRIYITDPQMTTTSYEPTTEMSTTESYASTEDTSAKETTDWTTTVVPTDVTKTSTSAETIDAASTDHTTLELTTESTQNDHQQTTTMLSIDATSSNGEQEITESPLATATNNNTSSKNETTKPSNTDSNSTNPNQNEATASTKTSTSGADNPSEQNGLDLEWWVWVLIAVGAVALMAIIALVINIIMSAASGAASNSTGLFSAIFGAKGMYAVNKPGAPTPVLTSESFLN